MPKITQNVPIGVRALQYLSLQEKGKEITSELKSVRVELEEFLKTSGIKNEKGHIIAITEHAGQKCEVKNERRLTSGLVDDAEAILKANLPEKTFNKLFEKVTVFREDVLTVFVQDGTIPSDLAEKLFETTESYAFKVKKVNNA